MNNTDIFWQETNDLLEMEDPIETETVIQYNGYKIEILYYDSGKVEAWIRGIGTIDTNYHWEGITFESFIDNVKTKLDKRRK